SRPEGLPPLSLALCEPSALALQRPRHRTDLLQVPVEGVEEVVVHQAVVDELSASLTGDEAGVLQDGEVLGNGGLGDREALGDLPRGQLRSEEHTSELQ